MNDDPPIPQSDDASTPSSGENKQRTLEQNLWDLDDEAGVPEEAPQKVVLPPAKLPEPRTRPQGRVINSDAVQTNVTAKGRSSASSPGVSRSGARKRKPDLLRPQPAKLEKEFNELDSWEDDGFPAEAIVPPGPAGTASATGRPDLLETETADVLAESPGSEQLMGNPPGVSEEEDPADQDTDVAARGFKIRIKPLEWIGLALLAVLLGVTAFLAFRWTVGDFSKATAAAGERFPIKGDKVTLVDAVSYWREPILDGPNRDSVRRGTRLIPVVELKVEGGPAALRLRFKDDEGSYVGDPLTHAVSKSGTKTFSGTAGFDDIGMHAAYRIGETEPWTVEVFEAASRDSPGEDFTLIHEFELAADIR